MKLKAFENCVTSSNSLLYVVGGTLMSVFEENCTKIKRLVKVFIYFVYVCNFNFNH